MRTKVNANAVIINTIFFSNIISLLILLLPHSSESGCLGGDFWKNTRCRDKIKYITDPDSERPKEKRQICLDKKKLHQIRELSEISSGWFSDDKDKHKIVIKKYNLKKNAKRAYTNSRTIFRMIKEKFPFEDQHRLLITAAEWGHQNNEETVIAMELAGQDLDSYLQINRPDFSDDKGIRATIRLLAQPLVLFHRELGIHLDVKPANYLYDKTGEFLKLNDFDGSHAFPDHVPIQRERRANFDVQLGSLMIETVDYSSPEMFNKWAVTTKADIWSLGMSIYDVLLCQKRYRLDKGRLKNVREFMVELFQKERLNKPSTRGEDLEWLLANLDSFKVLFRIKTEFPATFQLLNNLLNPDPAARMSARGVMKYTEGRCRPKMAQIRGNTAIFDDGMSNYLLNFKTERDRKMSVLPWLFEEALSKLQQETIVANNGDGLPECRRY